MFEALGPLIKEGEPAWSRRFPLNLNFFLCEAQADLVYVLKCLVLLWLPERHVPISYQPWKVWGGFDYSKNVMANSYLRKRRSGVTGLMLVLLVCLGWALCESHGGPRVLAS